MGLLKDENIIKKAQKELKLLENKVAKKTSKNEIVTDDNLNPKSILIFSSRALTKAEENELNSKLKLNKTYILEGENLQRWRNGSDEDIMCLKKFISECLNEGDYILIHGYYFLMQRIASFASSKNLKTIFLSEKFSEEDEYFKEI